MHEIEINDVEAERKERKLPQHQANNNRKTRNNDLNRKENERTKEKFTMQRRFNEVMMMCSYICTRARIYIFYDAQRWRSQAIRNELCHSPFQPFVEQNERKEFERIKNIVNQQRHHWMVFSILLSCFLLFFVCFVCLRVAPTPVLNEMCLTFTPTTKFRIFYNWKTKPIKRK